MLFTLNQAAKAANKGKSSILNAIEKGRLSAKKNEKGEWEIDAAELDRVYPLTPKIEPQQNCYVPPDTALLNAENSGLKARLEVMQDLLAEVKGERDNLRNQVTSLTALLPSPQKAQSEEPPHRTGFWGRLFRAA